MVAALRELSEQKEPNAIVQDVAAYLALALLAIERTVEASVGAWEKRGYWLKADRFRQEWSWSGKLGSIMRNAVLKEDWSSVAQTAAQIAEHLKGVPIPRRLANNHPWKGARQRLEGSK